MKDYEIFVLAVIVVVVIGFGLFVIQAHEKSSCAQSFASTVHTAKDIVDICGRP